LQKTKRDLAAAIIGAENSMIRDLRSEQVAEKVLKFFEICRDA